MRFTPACSICIALEWRKIWGEIFVGKCGFVCLAASKYFFKIYVTPARVSFPRWWFVNRGWSAFSGQDKPLSEKYVVEALAVLAMIGTNLVLRPFPVSVTVDGFCRRTSRTRRSQISWTRAQESYMRLSRSISRRPYLVEMSVWLKMLCTSSGER